MVGRAVVIRAVSLSIWCFFLMNSFRSLRHGTTNKGLLTSISARRSSKRKTDTVTTVSFTTAAMQSAIESSIKKATGSIIEGLRTKGWATVDNFFNDPFLCQIMRKEAEKLYEDGFFSRSQSTRWDPVANAQVYYDKNNVYATQLIGGDMYHVSPRLHEFCVFMTRAVVPEINMHFPEAEMSPTLASNKLSVCIGDGSAFDKHYDNSGLDDTRKVTILIYLNNDWRNELGGLFRIYNPINEGEETDHSKHMDSETTDIEPVMNRLLVFWSDRLVHSVTPSFAPGGACDHRYALTLWLTSTTPAAIVRDDAEVERHFGALK